METWQALIIVLLMAIAQVPVLFSGPVALLSFLVLNTITESLGREESLIPWVVSFMLAALTYVSVLIFAYRVLINL